MNPVNLSDQVTQVRNELHNLRKTIRGLQAQHKKDVLRLQSLLTENKAFTVTKNTISGQKCQDENPSKLLLCNNWTPIGYMRSWFKTKNGTPRQGSVSSLTRGRLKILKSIFNNPEHSLQGLEQYSHVWVFFVFDQNSGDGSGHSKPKVSPPRLDGERVGVFSTRSPHRPNPLGLTLATIEKVEGDCIYLSGLDILDGTPVLDIKPYIFQYDAPPVVVSHIQGSGERDNWDISESCKTQIPSTISHGPEQTATCTTMKTEEGLMETEEALLNSHARVDSNIILPSVDTSKSKISKLQVKEECSSPSPHSYDKKDDFHEQHLGDDVNNKLQRENNFKHTKPSSTKIIVQENELNKQFSLPNYLSGKSKVVESVKEDTTFHLPLVNLGAKSSHLLSESESVVSSCSDSNNVSKGIESKNYPRDFESDNIPRDIDSSIMPRDSDSVKILRESESINILGDSECISDLTSHLTQSNTYSSNRGPVIEGCDSYNSTRERLSESINDISPQSLTTANDSSQGKEEEYGVLSASWVKSPPLRQLQVRFNPIADGQINQFSKTAQEASYRLEFLSDGVELRGAISSVLSEDPRSIYRRHKCPSLLYYFTVDTAHVTAWFDDALVEVLRVKPLGEQSLDHGVGSEQAAGMKKDSKVII